MTMTTKQTIVEMTTEASIIVRVLTQTRQEETVILSNGFPIVGEYNGTDFYFSDGVEQIAVASEFEAVFVLVDLMKWAAVTPIDSEYAVAA